MSGIVGSRFNIRGSGLVGSLGSDGQAFTSSGAGTSIAFEAAGGFAADDITGATALATEPALTDEMMISDAGTLKRLDITHILGAPLISLHVNNSPQTSTATATRQPWNIVDRQVGGTWANDATFTPGVAGWYITHIASRIPGYPQTTSPYDGQFYKWMMYKNGSAFEDRAQLKMYAHEDAQTYWTNSHDPQTGPAMLIFLDADDYIESYVYHDGGGTFPQDGYSQWTVARVAGFGSAA
tara:strand:- start:2938 stop:3654 length:717 start_codon:yes stop_codon:yes gene_type:complete